MRKFTLSLLLILTLFSFQAFAAGPPKVEMFSPQGGVKDVRQAVARFSEQMVSFGDPRLEDPFTVQCGAGVKGAGRWVDGSTWTYDFDKDLPAGVICKFTLKPGTKTLKGELVAPAGFAFNTGGPSVRRTIPYAGSGEIDEEQIFLFLLDALPEADSVEKNVYCSIEGIKEKVGISIVTGEEKNSIMKILKYRYGKLTPSNIMFKCRQAFPPSREVKIIWGAGVKAATGTPTEKDQEFTFKARRPFQAHFQCMREQSAAGCIPVSPMYLSFTASFPKADARKIVLKSSGGKTWSPSVQGDEDGLTSYVNFPGPFPEKTNFQLIIPKGLKDESGRALTNIDKFPLAVRTDANPPLAKFASSFGIIEYDRNAYLPLTVRNIEASIRIWEKRITGQSNQADQAKSGREETLKNYRATLRQVRYTREQAIIDRLRDINFADREIPLLGKKQAQSEITINPDISPQETQVIGVPLKNPGFYVLELESGILGTRLLRKPKPMYVATGALVTNMAVHFKHGRSSSLVWVTSLDRGEPVRNASVSVLDCSGKKLWEGKTDSSGAARVGKQLAEARCRNERAYPRHHEYNPALSEMDSGFFVFARSGSDLSFTHSSWDRGIEPWRFQVPSGYGEGTDPLIIHTVFARTLLRAGDEVQMKHFVRKRTMKGMFVPPGKETPGKMVIEHSASNQQYPVPVTWKENGAALSSWKIPREAKLGHYRVYFVQEAKKGRPSHLESGSFRVEEFRVPLMTGFIKGPAKPAVNAESIDLDISLKYFSGGAASGQPVKLRTEFRPKHVYMPEYGEYVFNNGPVKTGIVKRGMTRDSEEEDEAGTAKEARDQKIQTRDITLDISGASRAAVALPKSDTPREIAAELEFRDPNGEVQTVSSRVPYYPSEYLVGIGPENELKKDLEFKVSVLDLAGRPVLNAEVKVDLFERKTYSHRKRIHGGFYTFESATETKKVGGYCEGRTDAKGLLACGGKPSVAGALVFEARTADRKGNVSITSREMRLYVEDSWDAPRNDDRIDLTPENRKYEPGQKMRLKAGYPFKTGTALVTVEREGVMDYYVRRITRKSPHIEIPVKSNYVPNVFVSALIVKGRTPNTKPTATFDSGKPSYRLGLTEVEIGWRSHELKLDIETDKKLYATRAKVRTKVRVRTAAGKLPPKGSELAVAVVDEALLELASNNSWDLLPAMMRKKVLEVKSSTAQMMVTGKRHFGRKALAQGGGGGKRITRELFDTLVFWKGVVPLDDKGEASFEFPLNDSLTSFRIVAIASGGKGLFGNGQTSIRASRDLMVLPGVPQVVREGDRFNAGFTVRNLSQKDMDVEASLKVEGAQVPQAGPLKISLKAGESREIGWDVNVPFGAERLVYLASVKDLAAGEGMAPGDSVKVSQRVAPYVPVRTFQATMAQLREPLKMEVAIPADAVPGRGGINVEVRARIADGLAGIKEYMSLYPYSCLEQKISKAVALGDRAAWDRIMSELPAYLDSDGLAKYFPTMDYGSDVMTAYILAIANEAGYPVPRQERMIEGLKRFVEGKIRRRALFDRPDLSIRKLAAIEALSRYGEAEAKMLSTITINPAIWPTSAVLDWINILLRVKDIPQGANQLREAENTLRTHIYYQGTTMNFSTERTDYLWWLMVTPDVNAVKTLLTILKLPGWEKDSPLMMRGVSRPDAQGPLGHDNRQCLGGPRRRQILRKIRVRAGDGPHDGDA